MSRQINRLLQSHASPAQFHLRSIDDGVWNLQRAISLEVFHKSVGTINGTRSIIAYNTYSLSLSKQRKTFGRFAYGVGSHSDTNLVALRHRLNVVGYKRCRIIRLWQRLHSSNCSFLVSARSKRCSYGKGKKSLSYCHFLY